MRSLLRAAVLGAAASAGCATSPDAPPPAFQSAYSSTGEIRIGRYYFAANDRIAKRDINVYRLLLSKTWVARRGEKVNDPFCRLAFPGTAPTDDLAMGALLEEFARAGFFNLPRRTDVRADDILVPGKNADALIVETDRVHAVVFQRDLAGPAQNRCYFTCVKLFEQLAEANRPAVIGVGVERRDTFLERLLRQPPKGGGEEPAPAIDLKPAPFTPEARRQMEAEQQPPPPPSGAPPK